MSTTTKNKNRIASVKASTELTAIAEKAEKTSTWRPSVLILANQIAKQEYNLSQFWNKIQKDRDDCYISLAFCKLCERETKRNILSLKEIPFTILVNHFLPIFNAAKKFPLKTEKCTWYTVSVFLSYIANMPENDFNEVLNFGLQHKPKK